ncbi:MAG: 8-oxo-dGTP diphosphatase [Saprospiraceae bacterium]|jgi:8-oxo-dGTP diphosphatase
MRTTAVNKIELMARKRIDVAVGILINEHAQLFAQQRPEGTDCAGKWEFPGGKLEPGESAVDALVRELKEELGITLVAQQPLTVLEHNYAHADVRLHTYLCQQWEGKPIGLEGQTTLWAEPSAIAELDLLEAAVPLLNLANQALAS